MVAHFPLERLAQALRSDGVFCNVVPDAQGKSARQYATIGYPAGCQAVGLHHTVTSGDYPQNDIRYIDGGKEPGWIIANAYTSKAGVVTLIASGPTYTEGAGGPLGRIPAGGANRVCFSNEIASWGAHDSVYPPAQQDAVAAFAYHSARIAADVWGWDGDPFTSDRVFAHFEWAPSRKVDPRGVSRWSPAGGMWDMDAFRSELRDRRPQPPEGDDVRYMLKPYPGAPAGSPWFLRWDGTWSYLTGRDRALLTADGVPVFDDIAERYDLVHRQVFGQP